MHFHQREAKTILYERVNCFKADKVPRHIPITLRGGLGHKGLGTYSPPPDEEKSYFAHDLNLPMITGSVVSPLPP